jgi:hypothetical protein
MRCVNACSPQRNQHRDLSPITLLSMHIHWLLQPPFNYLSCSCLFLIEILNTGLLIRIFSNYLSEFKKIWTSNRKRLLIKFTWPNKWLSSPIFIWSGKFYNWSITITCLSRGRHEEKKKKPNEEWNRRDNTIARRILTKVWDLQAITCQKRKQLCWCVSILNFFFLKKWKC